MAVDTPAKIAILGAGPIGLETALYSRFLGYDVVVFDRGRVCEHVLRWGHAKMLTPFAANRSVLGLAAIQAHDEQYEAPADDALLTGAEWFERYLRPLSETDLLSDHLVPETEVLAVGKESLYKHDTPGHEDRGDWSFRILVRDSVGAERIEMADVVIDATGVFGQPIWMGHGGIPAVGESSARSAIEYWLPDITGRDRERYAGKRTLVVGSEWLAAANILSLAAVANEVSSTRVTWVTAGEFTSESDGIDRPGHSDFITGQQRVMAQARSIVSNKPDWLEHVPQTFVEAVAQRDNSFEVVLSGGREGTFTYDALISNAGFSPDRSLYRELQVKECFATERPGESRDPSSSPTMAELVQPEANFYVLGAKSSGRGPDRGFAHGLEQIRVLFTLIGDRETLDLYASAHSLLRRGE